MSMTYKLSDRKNQNGKMEIRLNSIDLGKIATVFILFSLLGFITAWVFSFELGKQAETRFLPYQAGSPEVFAALDVVKYNETYNISIKAVDLSSQSWSFVEGQVLDQNKEYLFSFGKELWDERGYDSDGPWHESEISYDIAVTFPKPGRYYLQVKTKSSTGIAPSIVMKMGKQLGSSIPHLWFGVICLMIGLVLNEIKNRTIRRLINEIEWD